MVNSEDCANSVCATSNKSPYGYGSTRCRSSRSAIFNEFRPCARTTCYTGMNRGRTVTSSDRVGCDNQNGMIARRKA